MNFIYNIVWMIRRFFIRIGQKISSFLQHPLRIFVICFAVAVTALIVNGTLLRLWNLNHNSNLIAERTTQLRNQTKKIDQKLRETRDPSFLELEARERLNLANKGDLVFVFSHK